MPQTLAPRVEDAQAACYCGTLYVIATALVSATNFEAGLERNPILILPPSNEFFVTQRPLDSLGTDVLTRRSVVTSFSQLIECPRTISLRAKENSIDVAVVQVTDPLLPSTASLLSSASVAGGGGEIPHPSLKLPIREDVATGFSKTSFEGAFDDAVSKLPPQQHIPDAWITVNVTASGAQLGGFAGWRRYFVSVSRVTFV